MKIVIAPDKFKDSLSASQVAAAIAAGIRSIDRSIDIDQCPMADGGEGTVAALVEATGGRIETRNVTGPIPGMHVDAPFGILGDGTTAVVEMAAASGLHLLKPEQRNPLRTTTYGTGELMRAAVELGAKRIILGIGGSATVDGGVGLAQAWGAEITLANGTLYTDSSRKLVGSDVARILSINRPGTGTTLAERRTPRRGKATRRLAHAGSGILDNEGVEVIVACDVGNPLFGPEGAAVIFGPQKGATPEQVEQLDASLKHLATRCGAMDLAEKPGAGAAGGLGFGMLAFFGATLKSGIEIVMEAANLRQRLKGADLCITGEGRLDEQSAFGKTPVGVSRLSREMKVPCIAIAGSIGPGAEKCFEEGISAYFSICNRPMTLAEAMQEARDLTTAAAANVMRIWWR